MSEQTIFTRIIRGEIPCHKIYEDDHTVAFMDIHPSVEGHVLVVSKKQADRLEDLSDVEYVAMMSTTRKVMKRVVEVYGDEFRACLKVMGFDVPHAHIHVMPCRDMGDYLTSQDMSVELDHAKLADVAQKLAF